MKPTQGTQEIQSHLAYIMQSSDNAIISKSIDGTIIYWNVGAERIFGYTSEEVLDKSINILTPHKTDEHNEILEKYRKGEKLENYETQRTKKDGSVIDVSLTILPILDDEKTLVGFSTIVRNIIKKSLYSQYARSLIEASLDPLVTISAHGKITDVNEALVKVTGAPREKLIGTDFSNYFTEPEKAREGYKQVFDKGFVSDYPLTIRHINQTVTDVLYNAAVYKDEQNNVLGVFAAARDITAQKQSSQYARSLIEASLDPLVTISPEGKITDVNEASVTVTGVPREELIGTDFSNYFTEPEKAREGYKQVFEKGFVADYPLTIRHINQTVTDVLYNAAVYKDEQNNVLGVFAAARDITAQKQSSQYARSLIEASLDPLVTISPDGKITDVNEASVRVTGVPRKELIGTDFSNYFTEPEKAREGYKQVFDKGFVSDYALTIRHINQTVTYVLYNASVYKDEKGNVLGIFAAARDITAQRKQEIKINTLNEELEQRIIELESFSYSVSHDLRAPLRGVDGFIAMFLNTYYDKVDEEGQRLLGNVRRNVTKMGSLIDELLSLSRVGMKDINITVIDMEELANTVLEELSDMRGNAEVRLKNLAFVKGDVALIKQVLVNLISNALKYSKNKEVPQLEIGCMQSGEEINYYIKDNGVGFDMQYSNKLFGVFQRLHDPKEYEGTGVGLAIVKRIITRHGGKVWAEAIENEGAIFYFSLKK